MVNVISRIVYLVLLLILFGMLMFVASQGKSIAYTDYDFRSTMYTNRILDEIGLETQSVSFRDDFLQHIIDDDEENSRMAVRLQVLENNDVLGVYYWNEQRFANIYPLSNAGLKTNKQTPYVAVRKERYVFDLQKDTKKLLRFDYVYVREGE